LVNATRGALALAHRLRGSSARTVSVAAALTALATYPIGAQEFDLGRAAINDSSVFAPFVVGRTQRLRDALEARAVDDDTPILVFDTRAGPVALITAQMTYHHVAQGDLAGEPWMVSF
jgi:hypothetical protein